MNKIGGDTILEIKHNGYGINTYEQLRKLDEESGFLKTYEMEQIKSVLGVSDEEIIDISILKKGMTNRSFLFRCKGKKYIMRIPGKGTDKLINRKEEYNVYQVIKDSEVGIDPIYINPNNGYAITTFIEGARVCNPYDADDVCLCMKHLRKFHRMKFKVEHKFRLFEQIDFYENLRDRKESIYRDYDDTKKKVYELKTYIEKQEKDSVLIHVDAVPDNFLIMDDCNTVRLIDWEYAGMQDPHLDIAMFAAYSMYDKEWVDRIIDIYFLGRCDVSTRIKIYCYISAVGLLWSNWCEYKRQLGIEFGEYSLRQYRYAKEYYKYAKMGIDNMGEMEWRK